MCNDANKTGDGASRGVSGYSSNKGAGVRTATTSSPTAQRVPAKVRSGPDEEGSSSEDDDDNPVIAAIEEDLMRWAPRGPPASPVFSIPKGTQPTGPKSDQNAGAAQGPKSTGPWPR